MRLRVLIPILLTSLLGGTVVHARTTFDPTTATLQLPNDRDTVRRYDFEDPARIEGISLSRSGEKLAPITESTAAEMLTDGPNDAVEGEHALRITGEKIIALTSDAFGSEVASKRFEISFWAREDGANVFGVLYFNGAYLSATVATTGRRTSDGWAEFVIGPVDGQLWGKRPIALMLFAGLYPSGSAPKEASILVDALEIRLVDGAPTAPKECTQANAAEICGADACAYGHCLASLFDAGPLPNEAHRRAIAERWIFYMNALLGDRKAVAMAGAEFASKARDLARNAVSSSQFYGGMRALVNRLRDGHTSFAIEAGGLELHKLAMGESSGYLGACFGVVDKDLLGGGLAYGVFATVSDGAVLEKGDVLTAIDGQDPKAWVDTYGPTFFYRMPNDPESDWGHSAVNLAALVSTRASTLTFTRCASSTDCSEGSRQVFTVEIGKLAYDAVSSGKPPLDRDENPNGTLACSPRFLEAVPHAGVATDEDVYVATPGEGDTRIQFDAFGSSASWLKSFEGVFAGRPPRVLVDARIGNGGDVDALRGLLDLLRDKNDPIVAVTAGRRAYDALDPHWGMDTVDRCSLSPSGSLAFDCVFANMLTPTVANPPGAASRIAWINTVDVSASDYLPRMLQGRRDFRIFGPHATVGAFGDFLQLPVTSPISMSGGSIQASDTKFGTDLASALAAPWESGKGVPPDVRVTQKLSDTLAGIDTLLEAADAWLKGP